MLTLEDAKLYLRIDGDEENGLIERLLSTAHDLCTAVARGQPDESGAKAFEIAELYALAYLYEHRDEADHKELTLTLRSLLFGVREDAF